MTGADLPGGQQLPGSNGNMVGVPVGAHKASGQRRAPWKTRNIWIVLPTRR
jgi:hypothetical protein